jgi:hypothetical protein
MAPNLRPAKKFRAARLKGLPESMQDSAARAVILLIEEDPEPGDDSAIAEGLDALARGEACLGAGNI